MADNPHRPTFFYSKSLLFHSIFNFPPDFIESSQYSQEWSCNHPGPEKIFSLYALKIAEIFTLCAILFSRLNGLVHCKVSFFIKTMPQARTIVGGAFVCAVWRPRLSCGLAAFYSKNRLCREREESPACQIAEALGSNLKRFIFLDLQRKWDTFSH